MDPNNQTTVPLGLDMNNFMPGANNFNKKNNLGSGASSEEQSIPHISESEDPKIIDDVQKQAPNFKIIISNRIKNLSKVSNVWDKGRNKSEAFEAANNTYDLATLNDLYNFAFIKTELNYIDIKVSGVITVFPTLLEMCSSNYDIYFKNGVLALWKLLKLYEQVIINTKQNQLCGIGIDISKEDKIRKYDIIISYFDKFVTSQSLARRLKGKQIDGLDLQKFVGEVKYFLNKCKGK